MDVNFCVNHPFASYGTGWFSHFLEHFSERNMRLVHAKFPLEFLVEFQEKFPGISPPFLIKRKEDQQTCHPHNIQLHLHSTIFY